MSDIIKSTILTLAILMTPSAVYFKHMAEKSKAKTIILEAKVIELEKEIVERMAIIDKIHMIEDYISNYESLPNKAHKDFLKMKEAIKEEK